MKENKLNNLLDNEEIIDLRLSYSKISDFDRNGPISLIRQTFVDNEGVKHGSLVETLMLDKLLSTNDFDKKAVLVSRLNEQVSFHLSEIVKLKEEMEEARKLANPETSIKNKVKMYAREVKPYLDRIRYHVDKLELIVDNELWPLPKYRELLFIR